MSRSAVGCNGAKMLRALHVETGMVDLSGDGPVGQGAGWAAGFSSWRHYSRGWYWRAAEGGSLHPSRDFPWVVGAGGGKKRALVTVDIPVASAPTGSSKSRGFGNVVLEGGWSVVKAEFSMPCKAEPSANDRCVENMNVCHRLVNTRIEAMRCWNYELYIPNSTKVSRSTSPLPSRFSDPTRARLGEAIC